MPLQGAHVHAMKRVWKCLFAGILLVNLMSCAHGRKSAEAPVVQSDTAADAQGNEAILLKLVEGHVADAAKNADADKGRVLKRKPYFYREYNVYPEGTTKAKALVQAQESRSVPWIGDVNLSKQRFVTRFHNKRREAEGDSNFLRETGKETITFELRSGQWTRVGSLFVAERTEENVNGEWVTVKETAKRTPASEDQSPGFFKRTWNKILGRNPDRDDEKAKKEKEKENKEQDAATKQQRTIQPGRAF